MMLARLQHDARTLSEERDQWENVRQSQLSEIRDIASEKLIDIDRAASRRYHVGRIAVEILLTHRRSELIGDQIEQSRRLLSEAEKDVKVLEKLKEKQEAEFEEESMRRADREREDCWFSAHAMEYSR